MPLVYNPALAIDKAFVNVTGGTSATLADSVGDVFNYTVTVTNTGNVTLTGVTVVDPLDRRGHRTCARRRRVGDGSLLEVARSGYTARTR